VRAFGRAADAKLGAVVVQGGFPIYCHMDREWPPALSGKDVVAEGTLEYTDHTRAQVSEAGEVSAGTTGGIFVLRPCEARASAP
jgi:hypothetical protein